MHRKKEKDDDNDYVYWDSRIFDERSDYVYLPCPSPVLQFYVQYVPVKGPFILKYPIVLNILLLCVCI